jgi:hypothetical protein
MAIELWTAQSWGVSVARLAPGDTLGDTDGNIVSSGGPSCAIEFFLRNQPLASYARGVRDPDLSFKIQIQTVRALNPSPHP